MMYFANTSANAGHGAIGIPVHLDWEEKKTKNVSFETKKTFIRFFKTVF